MKRQSSGHHQTYLNGRVVKEEERQAKQIERIAQMEERLERASKAVKTLSASLDEYAEALEDIRQLDAYYGSKQWKRDLADDEAGRLPEGLKRGVLSQDAVWNLLEDWREVNERLCETASTLSLRIDK